MLKKIIIIFLIPLGLISQSKFELPCKTTLLEKSLQVGLKQIGTVEKSNRNDGEVEKYLLAVGLTKGNPYCAAGQYYCFSVAANLLGIGENAIPIPKSGLANAIYNYAMANGTKKPYRAAMHDLIVWRRGNTLFGHIERIIEVLDKGNVITLAFNVANEVGREGVFAKKRNIYNPFRRLKIRGLIGFRGA